MRETNYIFKIITILFVSFVPISSRFKYGFRQSENLEPYLAFIKTDSGFCTGAIISSTFILTSLECLGSGDVAGKVFVGAKSVDSVSQALDFNDTNVQKNALLDVALIKVDTINEVADTVSIISFSTTEWKDINTTCQAFAYVNQKDMTRRRSRSVFIPVQEEGGGAAEGGATEGGGEEGGDATTMTPVNASAGMAIMKKEVKVEMGADACTCGTLQNILPTERKEDTMCVQDATTGKPTCFPPGALLVCEKELTGIETKVYTCSGLNQANATAGAEGGAEGAGGAGGEGGGDEGAPPGRRYYMRAWPDECSVDDRLDTFLYMGKLSAWLEEQGVKSLTAAAPKAPLSEGGGGTGVTFRGSAMLIAMLSLFARYC